MSYDIFISYRRQGGAHYARILKAELEARGYRDRVFLDYDELKDGRFDRRIMSAIEEAAVFIFILSPGALDRCRDEDDWVRQEILYAFEQERHIIPVNFDGLFKDFSPEVPQQIREVLGQHQFSKIDTESLLDASIEKLIVDRISPLVGRNDLREVNDKAAEITFLADTDCRISLFGKTLADAKADVPVAVRLRKGNYLLEYSSLQYPEISERQRYTVPDNDYFDYIEIKLKDLVDSLATKGARLLRVRHPMGLYGYMNLTGELVISYKYEWAEEFCEGFAIVKTAKDKYGFIDASGNQIVACIYKEVHSFSEGMAAVKTDAGWGYIDSSGRVVVPCRYNYAGMFSDGLAVVGTDEGKGYIDKAGMAVTPFCYHEASYFSDGMAAVQDKNGLWGFIDAQGRPAIPCIYSMVSFFEEGLAAVANDEDKWGVIDRRGRLVIPCIYEQVENFSEGLAAVANDDEKWGYVDMTGRLVIPCIYDGADDFSDGLAGVLSEKGTCGCIDKSGAVAIPFLYDSLERFCNGLVAAENADGKWGVIDRGGNEIVPFTYDNEIDVRLNFIIVENGLGLSAILNRTGAFLRPFIYKEILTVADDIIQGKTVNDEWEYIDSSGNLIKPH